MSSAITAAAGRLAGSSSEPDSVEQALAKGVAMSAAPANGAAADQGPGVPPVADGPPLPIPATAGDHHSVHQFLMAVFQGPCRDTFLASLDDPFYEPCDR